MIKITLAVDSLEELAQIKKIICESTCNCEEEPNICDGLDIENIDSEFDIANQIKIKNVKLKLNKFIDGNAKFKIDLATNTTSMDSFTGVEKIDNIYYVKRLGAIDAFGFSKLEMLQNEHNNTILPARIYKIIDNKVIDNYTYFGIENIDNDITEANFSENITLIFTDNQLTRSENITLDIVNGEGFLDISGYNVYQLEVLGVTIEVNTECGTIIK